MNAWPMPALITRAFVFHEGLLIWERGEKKFTSPASPGLLNSTGSFVVNQQDQTGPRIRLDLISKKV